VSARKREFFNCCCWRPRQQLFALQGFIFIFIFLTQLNLKYLRIKSRYTEFFTATILTSQNQDIIEP